MTMGPQVPDPRLGQWLEYMEGHERWWDSIWRAAAKRGDQEVTMTPEHGPPNYQVCDPRTEKPLADIWDVNHWVALRRQERFAEMFGAENTSKPNSGRDTKDESWGLSAGWQRQSQLYLSRVHIVMLLIILEPHV